jgi:hypothetical protein
MRATVCALFAVVTGCDDGVVIEVRAAAGSTTDSAQLIIGLTTCDGCPGIAPPDAAAILDGEVLYREASGSDIVIRSAAVDGDGIARFRLAASEVADRLPVAVAIGLTGDQIQSAAIIRDLPLDSAGRYRVDLVGAGPLLGQQPDPGNAHVAQIWRQRTGQGACMGFERWSAGQLKDRVFIVPEQDLDCDERTAPECAPYSYDGVGVASFDKASCATEVGPINNEVCKIGGPGCNERTGTSSTCAPTDYCIPGAYCSRPQCKLDLDMCLFGTPLDETLACTLPFVSAGPEVDDVCPTFDFDLTTSLPLNTTCLGPSAKLFLELQPATPRQFRDEVMFATTSQNAQQFAFRLGLKHVRDCTYRMELQGQKAAIANAVAKQSFVQLWVATPAGEPRKLLVPLTFQMPRVTAALECQMLASCHLEYLPGEDLERCMR